jgi:hypothetical protein
MSDDWKDAWQGVIDAIGQDFGDGATLWGPDVVEAGAVRRYLEPLEFDCALHCDRDVAREHGYDDIIAPYTSGMAFTLQALWSPGQHIFTNAERNAQPHVAALRPNLPPQAPPITGYFAADMEIDFLREVTVGERLGRRGNRLVGCKPKETRVGRGAFLTFESEMVSSNGDVVARTRSSIYCYQPHHSGSTEASA